jgi:hypothetical protein
MTEAALGQGMKQGQLDDVSEALARVQAEREQV